MVDDKVKLFHQKIYKMKTLLMTLLAGILFINAEAKNINEKNEDPSQLTKDQFYHDFGDVKIIEWSKNRNLDEVTFIKDGHTLNAFYDDEPLLVGTTENKKFSDLPPQTQKTLKTFYKDYSVGDIILFDDNEANETDMILYNQPFEDADNYFIELTKGNTKIIVEADMYGKTSYFTKLK